MPTDPTDVVKEDRHRFMASVRRTATCWLWRGAMDRRGKSGRGRFYRPGSSTNTSRAAYELFVGVIPPKAHVLHKCNIGMCVRPAHLYLGDHKTNMKQAADDGLCWAPTGEKHPGSKLTAAKVRQIRRLHRGDVPGRHNPRGARALARRFGVSDITIWRIVKGDSWKRSLSE